MMNRELRKEKSIQTALKTRLAVAVLAGLGILLIAACSGKGKAEPNRYDPCVEMKTEGENVSKLDREIESLAAERKAAARGNDTAKVAALDAKLARKKELMGMNKAALQKASRNCDEDMKAYHRYPENPQHKSEFP